MQRTILIALLISFSCFGQTELDPNKYYAITKTVFIDSEVYQKPRELQVFLPDQYFREPEREFKVVYVFDGQVQPIFNFVTGHTQFLSMRGSIEPMIVIGIVTEDRWDEFLPPNNYEETLQKYEPPMGHADLLIKHLDTEVAPYLKENYRVSDYTIGIGHSLGATFVSYACLETDKFFDFSILLSPNYEYDQEQFVQRFKNYAARDLKKEKQFYFAIGYGDDYEERFTPPLEKVIQILEKSNNPNIIWDFEKLDLSAHGLTWLGIDRGLLQLK